MRVLFAVWMGGVVVLGGAVAHAQERGQLGLTMGYPTAIGVVWHATDGVGLRADVNVQKTSSELEAGLIGSAGDVDTNSFGFGVAGLFYLGKRDNVSTYFSPRLGYTRTTSSQEVDQIVIPVIPVDLFPLPLPIPREIRNESSGFSMSGSFGAQYAPTRRFSVFGEVGVNYATQHSESSSFAAAEAEGSTFGIRSVVGVILYFN
jgi:hypothetical protein